MLIINYRSFGNSALISLKKNTWAYDLITEMNKYIAFKKDNVVEALVKSIKKKKIDAEVWIYGSFAKDRLKEHSDIDVLFLFKDENLLEKNKEAVQQIQEMLSEYYQRNFSFFTFDKKPVQKGIR